MDDNKNAQTQDLPVYGRLRLYNAVMGFFHLLQGLIMLWISNDFKLPITTSYLHFDTVAKTALTQTTKLFDIQIGPMVASFLFISALAHFFIVLPGVYEWYVTNIKRKINYVRWWEYAFSSSVMIVVIALLCGMFDMPSLILIFTLNAVMNLWGLMMEIHNQSTTETNWTAFIFGCISGIVPWIVLALYFYGAIGPNADSVPAFVYWILASLFVFFNCFAINMFLQYKKIGPWRNYVFGETMYILLSLVAKSLLAWQVFSGTLRPN
jgi:hypothetical protein